MIEVIYSSIAHLCLKTTIALHCTGISLALGRNQVYAIFVLLRVPQMFITLTTRNVLSFSHSLFLTHNQTHFLPLFVNLVPYLILISISIGVDKRNRA